MEKIKLALTHEELVKTFEMLERLDRNPETRDIYAWIEEIVHRLETLTYVCGCSCCGELYWCRDVGDHCPNCGEDIENTKTWDIWPAGVCFENPDEEMRQIYINRGDRSLLKPKEQK